MVECMESLPVLWPRARLRKGALAPRGRTGASPPPPTRPPGMGQYQCQSTHMITNDQVKHWGLERRVQTAGRRGRPTSHSGGMARSKHRMDRHADRKRNTQASSSTNGARVSYAPPAPQRASAAASARSPSRASPKTGPAEREQQEQNRHKNGAK